MSIAVAMGRGARAGILIQSAAALERLAGVDTLLIDKTGTLTEGKPRVTRIITAPGIGEAELLAMAGAVERSSEHALAGAIMAAAKSATPDLPQAQDFRSVTGKGVTARVNGRQVVLGTATLMRESHVALGDLAAQAEQLRADGATALFVGFDGQAAGVIAIADPIRQGTRLALDTLRAQGLHIAMLTGDDPKTANAIAAQLGIDDVHAGLLPEDKQSFAQTLKKSGKIVAMAGDGVNDAPALAEADVGIAMGNGTDVAMRSAAVVLVKGDLAGIVRAIALSRATLRNIRENLGFAFAYNMLGIPLAAGALYPAFHILLRPEIAALAMSLSSVSVIGNALRLRREHGTQK
jgi:Cu+-exporting ATPase